MQKIIPIKSRPIIGIIMCGIHKERQFVTDTYIQAIKRGGGIPVVLPYVRSSAIIKEYANLYKGFLFCGGDDISPLLFGQELKTSIGNTNLNFDIYQIKLIRYIMKLRKPILGICRGMQILNVSLGGTLYQDLSLYPGKPIHHIQLSSQRQEVSHSIKIKRRTKIASIFGTTLYVNSYHHQAIHKLGRGLIAAGISSDGIIEAIEYKNHPFVIGVQWHPECMINQSKPMQQLFKEFILVSRNYSSN